MEKNRRVEHGADRPGPFTEDLNQYGLPWAVIEDYKL